MPMLRDAATGIPEYRFPAFEGEEEIEHEGTVALTTQDGTVIVAAGPDIPDPDKPQPEPEEPDGDEDDNDQPSGNEEDDEHVPDENKHAPTREVPSDLPAPEWESPPRNPERFPDEPA